MIATWAGGGGGGRQYRLMGFSERGGGGGGVHVYCLIVGSNDSSVRVSAFESCPQTVARVFLRNQCALSVSV